MAWKSAIGLPNCRRSFAYASAASSAASPRPSAIAAMLMRPLSRMLIASVKPAPSRRRAARRGTRTSRSDELGGVARAAAHLAAQLARRRARRAALDRERGDAAWRLRRASVLASTTHTPPTVPCVMNILLPLSTQSSPSRARRACASAAAVRARARLGQRPRAEPLAGRELGQVALLAAPRCRSARCASEPRPLCEATVRPSEPSAREISSTIDRVRERVERAPP